jgi:hypothetical protein
VKRKTGPHGFHEAINSECYVRLILSPGNCPIGNKEEKLEPHIEMGKNRDLEIPDLGQEV